MGTDLPRIALCCLAFIATLFFWTGPAAADELRPAYVELNQVTDGEWDVLWKASANSRLGHFAELIVPESCQPIGNAERRYVATNVLTRQRLACAGDMAGQSIGLQGLELTTTDALVRITPLDGDTHTLRLTPDAPIVTIPQHDAIANVAWTYTIIGIEHIVFGFDHLLFVLALVLLLKGGWLVVQTVTAFTVAHSMTLVGASLGYLSLPSRPVEAVIALSIVFLAVEVVKAQQNARLHGNSDTAHLRLSQQFPWVVAFLFGLLHGFGFAGALAEIGLPQDAIPMALLTFNLGVELGQLAIVAVAFAALALLRRLHESSLHAAKMAASYAIGITATFWFIERMIP